MPRRDSIQNQAMSEDAAAAWLPRDVLARILLRLPTSDLRRFRRVCKEWREVILDPAFVEEYMHHGLQALTHTIVFFRGKSPAYKAKYPERFRYLPAKQPENGAGYLLDEQWQVRARFTVSESEDMVGACNGLLCFLDVLRDAINIVHPFTGESITMPLPPKTQRWHAHYAYCLGFDLISSRYKLLHLSELSKQRLYIYTIGEDTNWRSVHVAGKAPDDFYIYSSFKIVDGAAYWSVTGTDCLRELVRFDLATEEITSEFIEFSPPNDWYPFFVLGELDERVCLLTTQEQMVCIGVGARWENNRTVRRPPSRRLTLPQPLQRGHLLLADYKNGGLYAHPIAPASDDLGLGNLVLQTTICWKDACKAGTHSTPKCNTRGLFVPVAEGGGRRRVPQKDSTAKTYCYAPPLSPAPLASYFGKL